MNTCLKRCAVQNCMYYFKFQTPYCLTFSEKIIAYFTFPIGQITFECNTKHVMNFQNILFIFIETVDKTNWSFACYKKNNET